LRRFLLHSPEDTLKFGQVLGSLLRAGDVIALIGDLGAGKTTLTQGIAQGMGIKDRVTSPTFTLVQEYRGRVPLFHFDPYRLERPEDVYDFGFEEYLERGGVVVVEWADRIAALLPEEQLTLTLMETGERVEEWKSGGVEFSLEEAATVRRLEMEAAGTRYETLMSQLSNFPAAEKNGTL
jgi:tRNA threonylcarbamoyladenosine biosynthesis protein TsaE